MKEILLEECFNLDKKYLGKIVIPESDLNAMKGAIKADKEDKMGYRKYKDKVNKHFKEKVI